MRQEGCLFDPEKPHRSQRVCSDVVMTQAKMGLLSTVTLCWPHTSDNPRMCSMFMTGVVMEKQPVCYFNHLFSIINITEMKNEPFFITKRRSPLFPDTVEHLSRCGFMLRCATYSQNSQIAIVKCSQHSPSVCKNATTVSTAGRRKNDEAWAKSLGLFSHELQHLDRICTR